MSDFYVYQLLRPWNGVPCYVGKGRGARRDYHAKIGVKHYNKHLASIFKKAGSPLPVVVVAGNLTEDEAFALEIKLIADIGRKDQGKGPLANWTDGGEGTTQISDATRAKRSASIGSSWTQERLVAASIAQTGKRLTPESRAKISAANSGRKQSAETVAKIIEYWTPERRAARSAAMTPEARAAMSARCKEAVTDKTRAKLSGKSRAYQERSRKIKRYLFIDGELRPIKT